jgi:hypothetical protein
MNKYLASTEALIAYTCSLYKNSSTNSFLNVLKEKNKVLNNFRKKLNLITPFSLTALKFFEIGNVMEVFYKLYEDVELNDAILYSFGFHSWLHIQCKLKTHVEENRMSRVVYVDKVDNKNDNEKRKKKRKRETEEVEMNIKVKRKDLKKTRVNNVFSMKKMYYPQSIGEISSSVVKNDCDLDAHMIITGPNASGKTTTIKTCLLNLIMAQQFGFGCFESCRLTPVDNLHCYLNIPDTSGRDSLFQAEARRCKDIIDDVDEKGEDETHFCIFDELYSGTNPDEAVSAANAFMEYLISKRNIKCLLTTHYLKLCSKLAKKKLIDNYHMKTIESLENNTQFVYTYKLEKGISRVKGGIKVLVDMKFPQSILDSTKKE